MAKEIANLNVRIDADGSAFSSKLAQIQAQGEAHAKKTESMLRGISASQLFGVVGQIEGFANATAKAIDGIVGLANAMDDASISTGEWYDELKKIPLGFGNVMSASERMVDDISFSFGGQAVYAMRAYADAQSVVIRNTYELSKNTAVMRQRLEDAFRLSSVEGFDRQLMQIRIAAEGQLRDLNAIYERGGISTTNYEELFQLIDQTGTRLMQQARAQEEIRRAAEQTAAAERERAQAMQQAARAQAEETSMRQQEERRRGEFQGGMTSLRERYALLAEEDPRRRERMELEFRQRAEMQRITAGASGAGLDSVQTDALQREARALFDLQRRQMEERFRKEDADAEMMQNIDQFSRAKEAAMQEKKITEAQEMSFATAGFGGPSKEQKVGDEETHGLLRQMLRQLGSVPAGLAI